MLMKIILKELQPIELEKFATSIDKNTFLQKFTYYR